MNRSEVCASAPEAPLAMATKLRRYAGATLVGVAANLGLYMLFVHGFGWYEPVANIAAALLVMGPRFLLHKYWVWDHRARQRIGFEARVHSALTVAGLVLSTATAWLLAGMGASAVALMVGNVGSFAMVWVIRFFVSNSILFVEPPVGDRAD